MTAVLLSLALSVPVSDNPVHGRLTARRSISTGHDYHFNRVVHFNRLSRNQLTRQTPRFTTPKVLSINILGGQGLLTTPAGFFVQTQSPSITYTTYRSQTE